MNFTPQEIEHYALSKSSHPSVLCQEIAHYTQENFELSQMLSGPMVASFLGFLIKSLQVKSILEIGTFTGYSALAMAENLPDDGNIITLDVNKKTMSCAQTFWNRSQHANKITGMSGRALDLLKEIKGPFDLIFIDADKSNYLSYFKCSLERLTQNGIIVVDNVLWSGRVLDENDNDKSTPYIREFNDYVSEQKNLFHCMLPIRDGLMLVGKI